MSTERLFEELKAALTHLEGRRLRNIEERINQMAVDVSKLVAAVTQIKTDQAQNATDIKAIIDKLNSINTSDPTTQAAIDQATADLTTVAQGIEASNQSAEAAVAASGAPPATG